MNKTITIFKPEEMFNSASDVQEMLSQVTHAANIIAALPDELYETVMLAICNARKNKEAK